MTTKALPKVCLAQRIQDAGLSLLEGRVDCAILSEDGVPERAAVLREIADADGLLASLVVRVDEELLNAAKRLKVVSLYAVGYDNVALEAATRRGIMVTNTPGVLTDATADVAFMLLLMTARRAREADEILRGGAWTHWSPNFLVGPDVAGGTIGIVGMGSIGQAVARRAKGFGMRILYTSRTRRGELERSCGLEWRSLDDLLRESDFVSLNCPLTPETAGLIGESELRMMKKTAVLVNTSRGQVVDQRALYRACAEGWIFGAGLDVYEREPVPLSEPLLSLPNVVAMPHIGSAAVRSRDGMARLAAQNLLDALEGRRPAHLITPN